MNKLTSLIAVDDLLPKLYEVQCITERHMAFIEEVSSQFEKTKRLLRIMLKRSQADYDNFSNALDSVGQGHLARVFREGGGRFWLLLFSLESCWLDSGFCF